MNSLSLRYAQCAVINTEIEAVEAEINGLEAQIAERKELLRNKRIQKAALAPVYTLPHDVVCEILKAAYLHDFPHCRLDDGLPHTNSPVAISHVSRWWRTHALSVPFIWTCIHVTSQQPDHYAEVIKAYVARSRGLPLSVFFECAGQGPESRFRFPIPRMRPAVVNRFVSSWECLLAEKDRWKNLSLYVFDIEVTQRLFGRRPSNVSSIAYLPSLQYLGIAVEDLSNPWEFVRSAPKLQHFRCDIMSNYVRLSTTNLFTNLKELKLQDIAITRHRLMSVLGSCSRTLKFLALCDFDIRTGGEPPVSSSEVTLPKLRRLVLLRVHGPRGIATLLQAAPAVDTLRIAGKGDVMSVLESGTVTMPNVKTLHHVGSEGRVGIDAQSSRNLFLALPSVEFLLSSMVDISPRLWEAIAMDQSSGLGCTAWPCLNTIYWCDFVHEATLRAFVQHRARVDKPLTNFAWDDDDIETFSPDTLAAFKASKLAAVHVSRLPWPYSEGFPVPEVWWDSDINKPVLAPWHGSWHFWDQCERPTSRGVADEPIDSVLCGNPSVLALV